MNELIQSDQFKTYSLKDQRAIKNEQGFLNAMEQAFDQLLQREMDELHKPKRLNTHPETEFIERLKAARVLYGSNH